jgi:small subunit ribosomal protein S16
MGSRNGGGGSIRIRSDGVSLVIRMARGGKKHRPYYRIVVADKRASRDGRYVERLGSYDPLKSDNKSTLDVERAKYWLSTGAQPSDRIRKLLSLHGVEAHPPKHSKGPGKPPPRKDRKGRGKAAAAAAPAAVPAGEAPKAS